MLKWSLLLRKAMPIAADRAKEVFTDALVRHSEYGEELNEVYKWEWVHGQELTVEGVHEILVYEIGWREDRDWASMKMQPRSGECTAVEAGKTKARAAVKAALGNVVRMAAIRTKVAVDEVERTGKDRVERHRVKARNDIAQIVAETGILLNFVGRKVQRAKVTVERAARRCSKRTLRLSVVSGESSVCTVPRLIIGPGIVPRMVPSSNRVKGMAGERASTAKWALRRQGCRPATETRGKARRARGLMSRATQPNFLRNQDTQALRLGQLGQDERLKAKAVGA